MSENEKKPDGNVELHVCFHLVVTCNDNDREIIALFCRAGGRGLNQVANDMDIDIGKGGIADVHPTGKCDQCTEDDTDE